jgi:hypothetical protein
MNTPFTNWNNGWYGNTSSNFTGTNGTRPTVGTATLGTATRRPIAESNFGCNTTTNTNNGTCGTTTNCGP